jgi:hypothetical protein
MWQAFEGQCHAAAVLHRKRWRRLLEVTGGSGTPTWVLNGMFDPYQTMCLKKDSTAGIYRYDHRSKIIVRSKFKLDGT